MAVTINRIVDTLSAPLATAGECAGKLSAGVIPPKIADSYAGDLNTVRNALNGCIDQWSGLLTDMAHMSDEHNKGDIDVSMVADRFEGAYRTMARNVNEMVAGHISVKKKAMACVEEFAKGNFEAPLEAFPGKKAFINDTIERLRVNIKRVHRRDDPHVGRTQQGRYRRRDPDRPVRGRLTGPWPSGVNEMVVGHIAVKKKAMACVEEFSKGNFDALAGAVSGQESLHQRHHRAAARQRQALSSKR